MLLSPQRSWTVSEYLPAVWLSLGISMSRDLVYVTGLSSGEITEFVYHGIPTVATSFVQGLNIPNETHQ